MPSSRRNLRQTIELVPDGDGFASRHADVNWNGVVFGAQILAQTMAAAERHARNGRAVGSLNLTFSRPARAEPPLRFVPTTLSDGPSMSVVHVSTGQGGGPVASALVTLWENGAAPLPSRPMRHDLHPGPETLDGTVGQLGRLPSPDIHSAASLVRNAHVETRLIDAGAFLTAPSSRPVRFWIKARETLADEPALHRRALAYLSDFWLAYIPALPAIGLDGLDGLLVASVNHTLWFYAETRADEWHLAEVEAPALDAGRGLAIARFTHPTRGLALVAALQAVYRPRRT